MYAKLFCSILTSSVWSEDAETRIVWITLLALADKDGDVRASPSGLARMANVSAECCRIALDKFLSPDPESSSPEQEGRRIEVRQGGWNVINYTKHRGTQDLEARKQTWREASGKYRSKQPKPSTFVNISHQPSSASTLRHEMSTEAEADTDTDTDTKAEATSSSSEAVTKALAHVNIVNHNSESVVLPDAVRLLDGLPAGVVRVSWAAEISAARQGMHGPPLTDEQVARACRDYAGNGHLSGTPTLRHFRAFLKSAGRPEKLGAATPAGTRIERGLEVLRNYVKESEAKNGKL